MWDTLTQDDLARSRDKNRKNLGRITFDCMYCKVVRGERVQCSRGRRFSLEEDGSIPYILVAKGALVDACRSCKKFVDNR